MSEHAREYDPLFPRSYAASSTTSTSTAPRCYGGFEQQKRTWASTARRSQRIRVIAGLQLLLGLLVSCNYLWLSNIFMFIVGIIGLLAVRSERMSWTVVVSGCSFRTIVRTKRLWLTGCNVVVAWVVFIAECNGICTHCDAYTAFVREV